MIGERFYEPVKVGCSADFPGFATDSECDSEEGVWGERPRSVYGVRPRNRSGRTMAANLKLTWEQADHLCDILEEVRLTAFDERSAA